MVSQDDKIPLLYHIFRFLLSFVCADECPLQFKSLDWKGVEMRD